MGRKGNISAWYNNVNQNREWLPWGVYYGGGKGESGNDGREAQPEICMNLLLSSGKEPEAF